MKNNSEGGFGHLWLKGDKVKEPGVGVCVCVRTCVYTRVCACPWLGTDGEGVQGTSGSSLLKIERVCSSSETDSVKILSQAQPWD